MGQRPVIFLGFCAGGFGRNAASSRHGLDWVCLGSLSNCRRVRPRPLVQTGAVFRNFPANPDRFVIGITAQSSDRKKEKLKPGLAGVRQLDRLFIAKGLVGPFLRRSSQPG
jgi:hypothetical protein